jgi:GTP-binding protein HflX
MRAGQGKPEAATRGDIVKDDDPMSQAKTKAFAVHVEFTGKPAKTNPVRGLRSAEARLQELIGLALAIDLEVAGFALAAIQTPRPATLLGAGKIEELGEQIAESGAELVIINAALTAGQQRNLERGWKTKVIDRTGLILEIFGERARTKEGSLQVELAHLQYQKSRLVRSWTHLERQRGGFGFLGGPGESQLEIDRRLIQERIKRIESELEAVKRTRRLHRRSRARVPYPVVAIVGYTNAGKSTLFNRLTKSKVYAEDLLFATLDPTMREIALPHGRRIILSDTVGFVSDLPTMLVAAFRATLEEVTSADLILHVRDISHPESEAQAEDVEQVMKSLGVDEVRRRNILEVWNKIDRVTGQRNRAAIAVRAARSPQVVCVSALTGEGIEALLTAIETKLAERSGIYEVTLDAAEGAERNWLYENSEVLQRSTAADGAVTLTFRLDPVMAPVAAARFRNRLQPVSWRQAAE